MFRFVTINKITKLTLRNVLKKEQIDLIIQLFPRIQYLSLQHIPNRHIELIIRYTLLKIKEKYDLPSYKHLYFWF
jgi:predicted nuclease of predicted toxin-antitoxin system